MRSESKKNAPKDAATSNEAISSSYVTTQTNNLYDNRTDNCNGNVCMMRTEHGLLLYEFRQSNKSKRFMLKEYHGKHYAELREWYQVGDEWKPSRKGCTIPIDEIAPLYQALGGFNAQ